MPDAREPDAHRREERAPREGGSPRARAAAKPATAAARPVIAVFGPTGVGKTAVAVAVAERLRARGERPVAVSADALQVYAGLEILTGVASPAERERLEHRLVSFLPVDATSSAGEYAQRAHAEIDGLLAEGATPIVVGGTGLYLRAALAELEMRPSVPAETLAAYAARETAALEAELRDRAPHLAERIERGDRQRLIRALALHELGVEYPPARREEGGAPHGEGPAPRGEAAGTGLWTADTRHPTRLVALVMDREALYSAIDARVDAMVAAGAIEEVARADADGASPTARKALGFADLLTAAHDPAARDAAIEAMKRRTRQYARRQLTWLRKLPNAERHDVTGRTADEVADAITSA